MHPRPFNRIVSLAALTGILLFAAFMHLYLINAYPPGLDGDSMHDGLDALKLLRYNIWPFYIAINSNADPIYIYTAAAATGLFGAQTLSLRFAAVIYALWGVAATYLCVSELGRGSFDSRTRFLVAVFATGALAISQPFAFFNRMGLRFITELPFQMLAIWALARAARTAGRPARPSWPSPGVPGLWRTGRPARPSPPSPPFGGRWQSRPATTGPGLPAAAAALAYPAGWTRSAGLPMWAAAGALAGLTQYTYPAARVLPLLFFLILLIKFLQERPPLKTFAAGLGVYAGAALLALLPQIIWYAQYPQTFLARAGQTSFTQNPLYAEQGLGGVLGAKFDHYWQALHSYWDGQYNQIKEPLLPPFFYYGFLLGLGACLLHIRKWFVPLTLCGLGVMILPDLISGDRTWPHELRLVGAYPFVASLAGLGLASLWALAGRRPGVQRGLLAVLAAVGVYTAAAQAYEFFSMDGNFGRMYWGGNTWLRRVDNSVGRIIAEDGRAYLLPLVNYADTPVKYLTADRALSLHSALDSNGRLAPPLTDGQKQVRLLLPRGDDDELWTGDMTQWALVDGARVYVLPPLVASELEPLLPPQDDSTVIYGQGSNTPVRVGHWTDVTLGQLPLADHYRPEFVHDVCFEAGMCLIGASYSARALSPGGVLDAHLYWQVRRPVDEDYVMFVHLLDRDGRPVARADEFPFFHGYRTYEWQPGETVISQTRLIVPADLPPGPYAIEAGFYLPYLFERLKTIAPDGALTGDRAYLPDLKVPRPAVQPSGDYVPAEIVFGGEVALAGYRIDSLPQGSQPLRVTLWWRGLKPASQNWTAFFHLTPAADNLSLVGQLDRSLSGGAYPPSIWDAGEWVEEQIEVAPAPLAAGKYAVWVGLYSPLTLDRLAITESPGSIQDNRTLLLEFEIKPSS